MTDEQQKHLIQMLGPINDQAATNKVDEVYEEAKHHLHTFIERRRTAPELLPSYKIRKVVCDCNCMTIITDEGWYVHVSAEAGYEGSVVFSTGGQPDIEDARNLGILSKEQYGVYKDAQQAYLGRRREMDVKNRLKRLVQEAGADAIQESLNGL